MSKTNENALSDREPSFAEQARTLLARAGTAALATLSRDHPGYPFASLAAFAADEHGRPILLISRLAQHARNLGADPRASLLVSEPEADDSPSAPRATLLGPLEPVRDEEVDAARGLYLGRHSEAGRWAGFADFAFHRMAVERVYFVAGFGAMGWITAAEYAAAEPDPLLPSATGILAHMNADHADALGLYCRAFAGVAADSARMTAVDRLGFRVRARIGDEERDLRIPFVREARSAAETRTVLVEMVREARARCATER